MSKTFLSGFLTAIEDSHISVWGTLSRIYSHSTDRWSTKTSWGITQSYLSRGTQTDISKNWYNVSRKFKSSQPMEDGRSPMNILLILCTLLYTTRAYFMTTETNGTTGHGPKKSGQTSRRTFRQRIVSSKESRKSPLLQRVNTEQTTWERWTGLTMPSLTQRQQLQPT